ncbi:hypothetical protein BKA57DRAFT_448565 [Linnemannia elongata]|nr:hypothetical protein BKA57DRAFT_448565 [Linnemannia elongata]
MFALSMILLIAVLVEIGMTLAWGPLSRFPQGAAGGEGNVVIVSPERLQQGLYIRRCNYTSSRLSWVTPTRGTGLTRAFNLQQHYQQYEILQQQHQQHFQQQQHLQQQSQQSFTQPAPSIHRGY